MVFLVPFSRFVFGYLNTLAHELGHAIMAWGFGYPAVPAFDWRYGGGVTMSGDRSTPLMLLIVGALGVWTYSQRDNPRARNVLLGFGAFYGLAAFTPIHEIMRLAMGHTTELIIAGIFLYRALSGSAITHSIERPLYAACAVFMILENIVLSWGLMLDADARAAYGMAKGGGHWMDMSRIARDYLGVGLPFVAALLFLACLATPVLAYLAHRHAPKLFED